MSELTIINICLICNEDINKSKNVCLSNQSFIHKHCEESLYESIVSIENEIAIAKEIKSRIGNFARGLFSFFFKKKKMINTNIKDLEDRLIELKNTQKSIYDYWTTYPPDWNKRKEKIKSERNACDKCGKSKFRKKDSLEVHHKVPIWDGGSHLDSNLELLCKNCHKVEHKRNPYKFRKKKRALCNRYKAFLVEKPDLC